MSKTELIHELVKTLEPLENTLCFTVFYSFAEFLKSHHFCPSWDFEGYYYEVQYDNFNDLQVLRWTIYNSSEQEGYILKNNEIELLTKNIVEDWAEKELQNK